MTRNDNKRPIFFGSGLMQAGKRWLFGEGKPSMSKVVAEVRSPVFIVGCGRSGTTLLFDLLKRHQSLVSTTGFPDGEDHVGWIRHGGALISGLANPNNDSGHVGHHFCLHMNEADVTQDIRRAMHRYYAEEVLAERPTGRVVNKCPHLSNKLRYVLEIFPDARIVQIVRDPVAMVASWVKVMQAVPDLLIYWPDSDYPCLWVMPAGDAPGRRQCFARESRVYPGGGLLRFADYWAEVNRNIPSQLADMSDQLLTIRYEDLVADPTKLLRQVTDFCRLDPFVDVPVPIVLDRNSAWSSLIGEDDIRAIRVRCADVDKTFGYPPPALEA